MCVIRGDGSVRNSGGIRVISGSLCAVVALLLVSGCAASSRDYALAPPPPREDLTTFQLDRNKAQAYAASETLSVIETASGLPALSEQAIMAAEQEAASLKDCRIQDRFDRDGTAIAYQWGQSHRNRLGLEVDGIGFDGGSLEGMKLTYTMRLQPKKTKKERCRYNSHWQGLIGSGYNELMLREKNTVWQELRKLSSDVEGRLDTLTGY